MMAQFGKPPNVTTMEETVINSNTLSVKHLIIGNLATDIAGINFHIILHNVAMMVEIVLIIRIHPLIVI